MDNRLDWSDEDLELGLWIRLNYWDYFPEPCKECQRIVLGMSALDWDLVEIEIGLI